MPYTKGNKCWSRKAMNPSTGKVSKWTTCTDAQEERAVKSKAKAMGATVVKAVPLKRPNPMAVTVKAKPLPSAKQLKARKAFAKAAKAGGIKKGQKLK